MIFSLKIQNFFPGEFFSQILVRTGLGFKLKNRREYEETTGKRWEGKILVNYNFVAQ